MQVQQVSFKNNVVSGQESTKAISSKVSASMPEDKLELSVKNEDNTAKYVFIGLSLAAGILAVVKRKQIGEFFSKFSKSGKNISEELKTEVKVDSKIETKSEQSLNPKHTIDISILDKEELALYEKMTSKDSKNFDANTEQQLKTLSWPKIKNILRNSIEDLKNDAKSGTEKSVFERYIKLSNKDHFTAEQQRQIQIENRGKSSNSVLDFLIKKARNGDEAALSSPIFKRHVERMKSSANIDVLNPPKLYRMVGESEIDALLKENKLILSPNYNGVVYTTANPNGWGGQYRITFKNKEQFDLGLRNEWYLPHTEIKMDKGDQCLTYGGYTLDDVQAIHTQVEAGGEWEKLIFQAEK